MNFGFRISDFGFVTHPPGLFIAKAQRREDAKSTHLSRCSHSVAKPEPPIWPTDHTDKHRCFRFELGNPALPTSPSPPSTRKHRETLAGFLCVARSRPSNDGRVPLGRDTDSNVNVRHGVPTQRPALSERRPRHLSSSFNEWKAHTPRYNNTEERQNRRATGASAGEKTGGDGCLHPESSGFSPATGDY
jgi:hypothetical protein